MQKKLIALAIAGLSSAAFAQSNVTIYGTMDATFDNVRATGCQTAACVNYDSRNRGTMNSSFIGFKGVESLGNGLAVAFQIETTIGENAGATNTMPAASNYGWANRDTYIGLAGNFGTVAFGTLTGPSRALAAKMDVNAGGTGIGANTALIGKFGGGAAQAAFGGSGAGVFDQRFANTFAYISPNFSGFSGVVAYVPNENRTTSTAAAGSATNTSAWTIGLNYDNGPITVGYAWAKIKDSGTAGFSALGLNNVRNDRLAGKYDFGMATVGLMYDRTSANTVGGADAKVTSWYLPVTFKVGSAGKIIAQYGRVGDTKGTAGAVDSGAKHFEIGYEHSLSKRTTAKVLYSQINNDTNANYDFLYGVSNSNSTGTVGGVGLGADPKGFSVGIRHTF